MKNSKMLAILLFALILMVRLTGSLEAVPMGTAFTYQGRLMDTNSPADGLYDFEFRLFDDPCKSSQLGFTIVMIYVDVIDGYFTVELDFGQYAFNGDARWLEIDVRMSNSGGSFMTLGPRHELTPGPYAIYANKAEDANTVDNLHASAFSRRGHDHHSLNAADNDPCNALFVDDEGDVGIGTENPMQKLHVADSGMTSIFVHNTDDNVLGQLQADYSGVSLQSIFNHPIRFSINDIPRVCITTNGDVGIGTMGPDAKLDVWGEIIQRVTQIQADYVFEPGYGLELIEEHSEFMWREKHLPAIPKVKVDENGKEIIEVGAHRRGIVEELEKAHIYIEQLHMSNKALEARLAELESIVDELRGQQKQITVVKEVR